MNTLALPSFDALQPVRTPETASASKKRSDDSLRQDTLKAWQHYQATGLHASAAEVNAWLAQLAEGHDVEPPACHV